jgi:DNA-nicking Smr family endonuclease
MDQMKERLNGISTAMQDMRDERDKQVAANQTLQAQHAEQTQRVQTLGTQLEAKEVTIAARDSNLSALHREKLECEKQIDVHQQDIAALNQKLASMHNLAEERQGVCVCVC